MSEYNNFVKEHFHSAPGASAKEKFQAIGKMWREHKIARAKSNNRSDHVNNQGGNFFDDIVGGVKTAVKLAPLIGLGMEKKPRKKRASKKSEKAGSFLGDLVPFGHMIGLGMEEEKPKKKSKGGAILDTRVVTPMAAEVKNETGGIMHKDEFMKVLAHMQKQSKSKSFEKKHKAALKGAGMGEDAWNGFKTGFAMPFTALSSIFG